MLFSTKPKGDAERAAIARSRQLTDFRWTPARDVPTYIRNKGNTVLPEGVEVLGFPYASEEKNDKFLCENVSIESFLTAIPNPHSKLYQVGRAAYDALCYGIVCNGLVRYALGLKGRISTARWYTIPGMREVKPLGEYTVDELQLCDVLYAFCDERKHVALITDILRNESGEIVEVEVSEAVRPSCRRARYATEAFYVKYRLFALWRYDLMHQVPPLDEQTDSLLWNSGLEKVKPIIAVDNGNKSNYLESDDIIISVFSDGPDTVEIIKDGKIVEEIAVISKAFIPRKLPRGYYTVRLRDRDASVELCVNRAELSYKAVGGVIEVNADSCDPESEILYMDFRQKAAQPGSRVASLEKYEILNDDEIRTGRIVRPIPEGGKSFKVYFKNKYGIWTQPLIEIDAEG